MNKYPKRLKINCCGHNMKLAYGNYGQKGAIRHYFCLNCHKSVYTVQYYYKAEKIINESTIKALKEG